mmetsp:Transcript_441/g.1054  ORF Transcript_441/g.1054 Transcript_441/m.1054 type:complete len:461 (-) Transcript_441:81-1463(-)
MWLIVSSGYTMEEKVHIATTHLLPKQRRLHALERSEPELIESSRSGVQPPGEGSRQTKAAKTTAPDGAQQLDDQAEQPPRPPQPLQLPQEPLLLLSRAALADLISKWTMESGVRSLERRIAQICRWAALRLAGSEEAPVVHAAGSEEPQESERVAEVALADCGPTLEGRIIVDARHLPHIVGAEVFEPDLAERLTVGVSMGLGVTPTGGHLLFVEATRSKGTGQLTITGQLGEVMRESVSTAMSLLRSKIYYAILAANGEAQPIVRVGPTSAAVPAEVGTGPSLSVQEPVPDGVEATGRFQDVFQQFIAHADSSKNPFGNDDIHVHFPAAAIPKDGPSAGVATVMALASLLLGRPVRSDTAVTGEITLRGHVLPVGGIRDKVLAAHRAGVRHVLLPFGNQRHVKDEIPSSVVSDIDLHFVKHVDEALSWAFAENVKPWTPLVPTSSSPSVAPGFALLSKL